jgi:hypothetical protein
LVESVEIIENFEKEVAKVRGPFGNAVSKKMNEVLTKNEGFMILKKISKVIKGDILENLTIDVPINIIPKFKNAPITSVEVERSFSFFKNVLIFMLFLNKNSNKTIAHKKEYFIQKI